MASFVLPNVAKPRCLVWLFSDLGAVARSAVERLRIEVARQRVQSSSEAIERVAQVTGFRDPERMRRAFIRAFGQA
jgi:transcriptional regulator GlxA family with amidase domain